MKFPIVANGSIETTTPAELQQTLMAHEEARMRARSEGKKYGRLNPPVTGQAVAGVLKMGGDYVTGPTALAGGGGVGGSFGAPSPQPRAGYCWSFRRLAVAGLTNGATPDIVNLFRNQREANQWAAGPATLSGGDWQFNGNNFAYTFSFTELVFWEGETPILVSQGAFASTAVITLRGEYVEVPQVKMIEILAGTA